MLCVIRAKLFYYTKFQLGVSRNDSVNIARKYFVTKSEEEYCVKTINTIVSGNMSFKIMYIEMAHRL